MVFGVWCLVPSNVGMENVPGCIAPVYCQSRTAVQLKHLSKYCAATLYQSAAAGALVLLAMPTCRGSMRLLKRTSYQGIMYQVWSSLRQHIEVQSRSK